MWTRFMDMHSGGSCKLQWSLIYIEAPEQKAKIIFYNHFGNSPDRVTCTCCGQDYSTSEYSSLREATAYDRGCQGLIGPTFKSGKKKGRPRPGYRYRFLEKGGRIPKGYTASEYRPLYDYATLRDYIARENVLVIYKSEIKPEERQGELPTQGYVWV